MTRIFVGNLPTDIVDKDVEKEFAAYGAVNKVEVKHKRDPLTTEIMSTFAFVTISITDSVLDQCLQEFKNEKYRGRYLQVSVARESFIEKLKREREESTQSSINDTKPNVNTINAFRPNVIQTFNSDVEDTNEPLPSERYGTESESVIKRKSKLFTENGKIKIPSNTENNLVVQPAEMVKRKNFDEKSEKADRKRVESLINMKNTYNQQKKLVQQALSNVESTKSNKIIFDEVTSESVGKAKGKSIALFDEDDDDFDLTKSFAIKKEYEGKKGARLQKLQSRFGNDQRFKMDEHFLDEDDDDDEVSNEVSNEVGNGTDEPQTDERKWQYDMLESVIGKKLRPEMKKKSDNLMLRYDPTKNDHEKYEKVTKKKARAHETDSQPTKQMKTNEENEFQVSKEQFFNVTNQLAAALTPSSEGFSLLSMFGRTSDELDTKQTKSYQEVHLRAGQQNFLLNRGSFFKDDSSDEDIIEERITRPQKDSLNDSNRKNPKKSSKAEIWHEPFFIFEGDQRLQDGMSLFLSNSSAAITSEDFEVKQKQMREIIKRKIKKSIKNVLPRGARPNKRLGRLAKDIGK